MWSVIYIFFCLFFCNLLGVKVNNIVFFIIFAIQSLWYTSLIIICYDICSAKLSRSIRLHIGLTPSSNLSIIIKIWLSIILLLSRNPPKQRVIYFRASSFRSKYLNPLITLCCDLYIIKSFVFH